MSTNARDQEMFYSVYRGRQSGIYHLAYMRSAKVKAARLILDRNGIPLHDRSVLDHGFGTGTFLRACDPSCRIAGVEVDPMNVAAVRAMLEARGHDVRDIQVLDVAHWQEHPLLAQDRRYDLILLSHVLEHLADPVELLRRLSNNLAPGGAIVGLLPINELRPDENHKWVCNLALVTRWGDGSGLLVADHAELDHYIYYAQPLLYAKGFFGRAMAQGVSLLLGVLQYPFTPRGWFGIGRGLRMVGARPGQLAFLYRRR